jgi:anti-sigma-K factor RskA
MSDPTQPATLCDSAAAYVLGALPADERRAFEAHLDTCERCTRTVRELAGIPGLLARVSPADLVDSAAPLPDTLLPRVLAGVRRRRRRRFTALAAAAALVVAVGVGAAVVSGGSHHDGQQMSAVLAGVPLTATADLEAEPGGTRIDLLCKYDGGTPDDLPPYVLVVTGRDGTTQRLATWRVGPDGTSRVVGSVDLAPAEIASVEVRTDTGTPVLRLRR